MVTHELEIRFEAAKKINPESIRFLNRAEYEVKGREPYRVDSGSYTCTCQDFLRHNNPQSYKRALLCKHILAVLIRRESVGVVERFLELLSESPSAWLLPKLVGALSRAELDVYGRQVQFKAALTGEITVAGVQRT
jgi:hypothetical protein